MNTFLTLSQLCAEIEEVLNDSLQPTYWVQAEISSLSHKGGHLYLELVESGGSTPGRTFSTSNLAAKVRATCWAGTNELLMAYFESETGQQLQVGMNILVEAEVQFHAVYGLSLSIVNIDPGFTVGELARKRQQTIAQLEADGLLDAQQLLPLPTLIRRIAVISSPTAAGYGDFCHQLEQSGYRFETTLFGATMQGEGAERSILAALEEIAKTNDPYGEADRSTAGRLEMVNAFDAVAIIRGGGASTDLSCFDQYTLCAVCAQFELPVLTGIGHTRDVSVLDMVAHEALKTPTAVAEWLIHRMDAQLARIGQLTQRLARTAERQILIRRHRVEILEERLNACNPERIYRMGYSLMTKNGRIVRSVSELADGDRIETHLTDGTVQSTITCNPLRG
ncbi:MAG: exodeoxyribonuclease VII large subunit [Paludibacteraceae bacterium]|nr:exodeoxyribonuclease VII large subunit [Paludibacteraceae bacterium]